MAFSSQASGVPIPQSVVLNNNLNSTAAFGPPPASTVAAASPFISTPPVPAAGAVSMPAQPASAFSTTGSQPVVPQSLPAGAAGAAQSSSTQRWQTILPQQMPSSVPGSAAAGPPATVQTTTTISVPGSTTASQSVILPPTSGVVSAPAVPQPLPGIQTMPPINPMPSSVVVAPSVTPSVPQSAPLQGIQTMLPITGPSAPNLIISGAQTTPLAITAGPGASGNQTFVVGGSTIGTSTPTGPSPSVQSQATVYITRLLDMPVEDAFFGGVKTYCVRVLDGDMNELARTPDISGLPAEMIVGKETQTFDVTEHQGALDILTDAKLIYLQVEHGGGLLGGKVIGRCHISRVDSRSKSQWPYALSDLDDKPLERGIELRVHEGKRPQKAAVNLIAPSISTIQPGHGGHGSTVNPPISMGEGPLSTQMHSQMGSQMNQPGYMQSWMNPTQRPSALPSEHVHHFARMSQVGEMEDLSHGVSTKLVFSGALDLPPPNTMKGGNGLFGGGSPQVLVSILNETGSKELRRIGLFATHQQGKCLSINFPKSHNGQGTAMFIQTQLHFGGVSEEGSQFVKIALSYAQGTGPREPTELIGITDLIQVTWKPKTLETFVLTNPNDKSKMQGSIRLSECRLVTEAQASRERSREENHIAAENKRMQAMVGPVLDPSMQSSGRTGNFPPGSQEEAFEQAAINAEAQNRALLQRVKKDDPNSLKDFISNQPNIRVVNGFREWDSLDGLFHSMGPNPLTLSEELGPAVARGYQHVSSIAKEVAPRLSPAQTPADQLVNVEMLRMMYKHDPTQVKTAVRPVICKDPHQIAGPRDMSWCPDPPVYVPMRNMNESDKETLRLACYEPGQIAAIGFNDANPNYRMHEDIWALMNQEKDARSHFHPHHDTRYRRVKDDCMMA
eukprot:TRINITY_DN14971_c1_g6_i1.p1 TRINITY_DN14971_c1_g6~~TRINITY_DN14971_c1_g6_i1.p1  ORF type:complete len:901 (+),score=139.42 TRINITY_DN14971_c1_g6_i1:110-2812(+)